MPYPALLVQHHLCRSVNTGVISQGRQRKQRAPASCEDIRYVILLDIIQQNRACFGYAAADYKNFRIHNACNVGKLLTQDFTELLRHLDCQLIPCLYRIEYGLGGNAVVPSQAAGLIISRQPALCKPYDTGCGGVLLQAAVVAAVAHFLLAVHHMDVSEFCRRR